MAKFTKKPVTISATQWFKNGDHPQVRAIAPSDDLFFTGMGGATLTDREKYGVIGTLESPNHLVTPGDWIITGVAGEHYPCKPDIFEATYGVALPVVDPGPDSLEREIQAKADKAPRVKPADVKAEIVGETFTLLPSGRVTVCELTLKNGFTVRGESAVVFIENFNEEIGRKVARENAEKEVWQLLGFRLRDELARPVLTEADALADLAGEPRPS